MDGVTRPGGDRGRTGLAGLDRGLLVRAHDDMALSAQFLGTLVQVQNDGFLEEARIGGVLPATVLPRFDLVGYQPALHSRGRDVRDNTELDHGSRELARRPARQRFTRVTGQGAGEGGHSRPDRGAKKSAARRAAGLPGMSAPPGCGSATCVPSGRYSPPHEQWPRYSTRDVRRRATRSLRVPLPRRVLSGAG